MFMPSAAAVYAPAYSLLSLGAAGSGVSFHQHSAAWVLLFAGMKLWLVYPPDMLCNRTAADEHCVSAETYTKIVSRDVADILQDLPQIPAHERPMVMVQGAGELVVVPQFWWHATINLHESVGIGEQHKGHASAFYTRHRSAMRSVAQGRRKRRS